MPYSAPISSAAFFVIVTNSARNSSSPFADVATLITSAIVHDPAYSLRRSCMPKPATAAANFVSSSASSKPAPSSVTGKSTSVLVSPSGCL